MPTIVVTFNENCRIMDTIQLTEESAAMENYLGIQGSEIDVNSNLGYVNLVEEGLEANAIESFIKASELNQKQVSKLIHLSERTIQRSSPNKKLDCLTSERLVSLSRIYFLGSRIFGGKQKFVKWIKRPNRGMQGKEPIKLMETNLGLEMVRDELQRIESGVFS